VVDAKSQHLLWTALRWAAAALHQIERVRDSWEQFQAVRKSWLNGGTIRVTPEMERPSDHRETAKAGKLAARYLAVIDANSARGLSHEDHGLPSRGRLAMASPCL
jgi:hypothetical protein